MLIIPLVTFTLQVIVVDSFDPVHDVVSLKVDQNLHDTDTESVNKAKYLEKYEKHQGPLAIPGAQPQDIFIGVIVDPFNLRRYHT
jgi:transaldolase